MTDDKGGLMKHGRRLACVAAFAVASLLAGTTHADPIPGSISVSGGIFQVGTVPKFTVAPTVSIHLTSPLSLTFQNTTLLFPEPGRFGFNNQTSVGLGYFSDDLNIDLAASLSQYWMDACGTALCGRVVGLAPGGRFRVSYFAWDSFGLSVNGDLGWYGGRSLVLPGGPAFMAVVGPIFSWKK